MADPSPLIAAGGSVALFIAVSGLLVRLLFLQDRREKQLDREIALLRQDNDWCNRRVSTLIWACHQGGIAIPEEVWNGPPSELADRRRGARGSSGPFPDRDFRDRTDP